MNNDNDLVVSVHAEITKRALIDWLDEFVEHDHAKKCNGYQSAMRFRDAIEEKFRIHCNIPHSPSLIEPNAN